MNLLKFIRKFPSEKICLESFAKYRLERGISCKKCESKTEHWWNLSDKKFQCKVCKSKKSYKSGTLMQNSKIGIQVWFMLIHLMTSIKKSMSALEVSRQLDTRYDTIWYAMHKIRCAMGKRDAQYKLDGTVELDDAFFVAVDLERDKDEPLKRGRGSQRTAKVMVMVESEKVAKKDIKSKHNKGRKMGFVKMVVMEDLSAPEINYEAEQALKPSVSVIADDWKGYRGLDQVIAKVKQTVTPPEKAMEHLPWVHTVISNAKKMTLGVHHSVSKQYLQNYLNEFVWKINRRNFASDPFERAVCMAVDSYWN